MNAGIEKLTREINKAKDKDGKIEIPTARFIKLFRSDKDFEYYLKQFGVAVIKRDDINNKIVLYF